MKLLKFYGGGVKKHFLKVVAAATVAVALFVGCTNNALDANIKTPGNPTPTPTPIVSPAAVLDTTLPTPKTIKVIATTTENTSTEKVIYGQELTLHGQIRKENGEPASRYERLPQTLLDKKGASDNNAVANGDLNKIVSQGLNKESAGLYFSFETDTTSLKLSGEFTKAPTVATSNSNQRFINGHFDLYELKNNTWTYVGTAGTTVNQTSFTDLAVSNLNNTSKEKRKYLLLFPLYNGVAYQAGSGDNVTPTKDLKLTVDKDCYFADAEFMGESTRLPILIYGTSITQGASPEHVGEAYTSQVMLQLKREVINMGFSGSAYTHEEMGNFIAGIKSEICFMDPTMNHSVSTIEGIRGIDTFAKKYRDANPNTPIVLVSQFDNQNGGKLNFSTELADGEIMKKCYESLVEQYPQVSFISRLTSDGDAFVPTCKNDGMGIHPDTAGMTIWAQKYIDHVTTIKLVPTSKSLTDGIMITTALDLSKFKATVKDGSFDARIDTTKKRLFLTPKRSAVTGDVEIVFSDGSSKTHTCTIGREWLGRYYETAGKQFKFDLVKMFHFQSNTSPTNSAESRMNGWGPTTFQNNGFTWDSGTEHFVKSTTTSGTIGLALWQTSDSTQHFDDFDYVEFKFRSGENFGTKIGLSANTANSANGGYWGYENGYFGFSTTSGTISEENRIATTYNDASTDWVTFGFWNNTEGKGALFTENCKAQYNAEYAGTENCNTKNSNSTGDFVQFLATSKTNEWVEIDYIAFYKKVN